MISDKTESERTIILKADDGEKPVKFDNVKLPSLTIKKVDSKTKQPVPGAVFEISLADGSSAGPGTAITNAEGVIFLENLVADKYIVKEISYARTLYLGQNS